MSKGLFYIALVLLFGTVWLALSDNLYDNAMEQYRNEYEWYLEKVNGYCTEESSFYLEQEAERIAEAVVELNLNTFEEKTIFEQITNFGRSLLGIDYETGDK